MVSVWDGYGFSFTHHVPLVYVRVGVSTPYVGLNKAGGEVERGGARLSVPWNGDSQEVTGGALD